MLRALLLRQGPKDLLFRGTTHKNELAMPEMAYKRLLNWLGFSPWMMAQSQGVFLEDTHDLFWGFHTWTTPLIKKLATHNLQRKVHFFLCVPWSAISRLVSSCCTFQSASFEYIMNVSFLSTVFIWDFLILLIRFSRL